jgi:hypothetical protein
MTGWLIAFWCVAAAALIGAVLFGGLAALGFSVDRDMDRDGVTTTAAVTGVRGDRITVAFITDDEQMATAEFTWFTEPKPAEGDRIAITYDSSNPSYVVAAGSSEDQVIATVFAIIGAYASAVAAGCFVGAILIHRARAARPAWPGTPWAAAG